MQTLVRQTRPLNGSLSKVAEARGFSGAPVHFWPTCLEAMASVAAAEAGFLLVGSEESPWKCSALWPNDLSAKARARMVGPVLDELAELCVVEGTAVREVSDALRETGEAWLVAVPLDARPSQQKCVALFLLRDPEIQPQEALARLQLLGDTPALYQARRMEAAAKVDISRVAAILDLLALLNEKNRFMEAAMCLCNELAARFQCDRVSLGWVQRGLVRLQAISHSEKFEKKMEIVQRLETVMEEAFEQDTEILWPAATGSGLITRDHQAFAANQNVGHICSLPLRVEDEVVAILSCERSEGAFHDEEIKVMHLSCDMAARRLDTLKRLDRWFGARFIQWSREKVGKLIGIEHTWWKLLGLAVTIGLAVLLFGRATYRVEAPFSLRADAVAYVPAPFEGYILSTPVMEGDTIQKGQPLLVIDTRDLRLEESLSVANLVRYQQEKERARAESRLSEMRIAQALEDQARAKLDLVRLHLAQSTVRAPIDGIIIEGEFKDHLGAPVKKGDILFRIASPESIYVELDVDEREIQEVGGEEVGEIAFTSRPESKFQIQLDRVDPIATVKRDGNVFHAKAKLQENPAPWWRPGMSGIAKVDIGKRNLFWIFTHKTVDYLRLLLWW